MTQLARLYFDTAIAGTAASIGPVLELTEPDHIVFGTDLRIDGHVMSIC